MKQNRNEYIVLEKLGEKVKSLIEKDRSECQELVVQALVKYPHAPQPQNLLGILAEKQGDLALAMKHYRAAWSLSPNYRPSRKNIDRLVSLSSFQCYYYDQECCEMETQDSQGLFKRKIII